MIEKTTCYKAIIRKVNLSKEEESDVPYEGDAVFSVIDNIGKEITIECFLYDDVLSKVWNSLIRNKEAIVWNVWNTLKENKEATICLYFLQFEYKKNQSKKKYMKLIKVLKTAVNHYQINGEVIKLKKMGDRLSIVLDCGLNINTHLPTKEKIKIGDYLYLDGRLDVDNIEM